MSSLLMPITVTLGGTQSRPLEDWHIFGKKNPTPYKTKVRIWAGLDYNRTNAGRSSLGGTRPKILLYDELGRHLGNTLAVPKDGILDKKPKEGIPEGSFRDYEIEIWDRQNENASRSWVRGNTRASYMAISADGNDAICISAIAIMYPDGGSDLILGDIPARLCGWRSYVSATELPIPGRGSATYRPQCFWLDGDDSFGDRKKPWAKGSNMPYTVGFHIRDFRGNNDTVNALRKSKDLFCGSSGRMETWSKDQNAEAWVNVFNPPLTYDGDNPTYLDPKYVTNHNVKQWITSDRGGFTKRSATPAVDRQETDASTANEESEPNEMHQLWWALSTSTELDMSAEYVCSLPNMAGPHYANLHEGKFCKLDDHTVWDLCGGDIKTNCFDMDSQVLWGGSSAMSNTAFTTQSLNGTAANPIMSLQYRIDM
ncbi:hypothetical protein LTR99_008865 [Exophiala xenobiotica]|uniref:Uncharacterized protein n=1 Tax=Vermiconidia calcicola TaxID=1690605 RepID=A0AAV9Q3M7_9PEZI|nr:hypothetical protein LTR92_009509 [Exophiala xenobiotica]KAK5533509.1 hypothetical protein LTR25_007375 [Vermiconidia calcicola]KAK5537074.1 hypothetical protein LTR23_007623 [Chaetothyriales sp. CCFEE 6169]KAK5265727.1 hypothetical protein LTR96_009134 [Exophiala xenobiotica]KAK5296498.1 hypothetical protein LTR99_008865 [Exophiala xenobiotica]